MNNPATESKHTPTNPNNCNACGHKQHPDDGWCYMFRFEPTTPCMQHTVRFEAARAQRMIALMRAALHQSTGGADHG